MESRNEVERDWNASTVIDGLARGGRYFYIDENGDRHEFYKAANGEITASGEMTFNGTKKAYIQQGDIAMASVFKKEIFEKLKRVEAIANNDKDERVSEKMNKMADDIHKRIEEKLKAGMSFEDAWDITTEELATDIIMRQNETSVPENKFLEDLRKGVNEVPTADELEMGVGNNEPIKTTPEVPGE